jgi:hypothetical protein
MVAARQCIFSLLLVLITTINVACNPTKNQAPAKRTDDSVMKVEVAVGQKLTPGVALLLTEVGGLYGIPVKVEAIKNEDRNYGGESIVEDDGTPKVLINSEGAFKQETLAHELYHLKFRKQGYPRYVPGSFGNFEINPEAFGLLVSEVRDSIQHVIFFPEIRKLGLDPTLNLRAIYRQALRRGDIEKIPIPQLRAIVYMRVALEAGDPALLTETEKVYRKADWGESINLGRELITIVEGLCLTEISCPTG